MHTYVHCSIIYNNQDKESKCPSMDGWINLSYIPTYVYISYIDIYMKSHRKNEIMPFTTAWVYIGGITLSEISQTGEDKYWMDNLTYMWNLK